MEPRKSRTVCAARRTSAGCGRTWTPKPWMRQGSSPRLVRDRTGRGWTPSRRTAATPRSLYGDDRVVPVGQRGDVEVLLGERRQTGPLHCASAARTAGWTSASATASSPGQVTAASNSISGAEGRRASRRWRVSARRRTPSRRCRRFARAASPRLSRPHRAWGRTRTAPGRRRGSGSTRGVRTQADGRRAAGHRGRRPGRSAAGDASRGGRVRRRPVRRVDSRVPEPEADGLRDTGDRRAYCEQTSHAVGRRGLRRRLTEPGRVAGADALSLDREEVGDGDA